MKLWPYRGNDSKIRQMCSSSTWVITQYHITFFQSVAKLLNLQKNFHAQDKWYQYVLK